MRCAVHGVVYLSEQGCPRCPARPPSAQAPSVHVNAEERAKLPSGGNKTGNTGAANRAGVHIIRGGEVSAQPADWRLIQYQERLAEARKDVEKHAIPPPGCPMCGEIPYPLVATQHCWCDPADLVSSKP